MMHPAPIGTDDITRASPTTPTHPATSAQSQPVVSDEQAREVAGQGIQLGRPAGTVTGPLTVTTHAAASTAAQVLDASIEARLGQIVKPKQRNHAHMVNFMNVLRTVDRNATSKQAIKANEAALAAAVPHFIQAYYATLAEVEGPQRIAGRILNMHNWLLEVNNMLATVAIWSMTLGVELTKHEPPDPLHPPAVPKSTLPGFVPSAVGLPILLLVMYINGNKGAKDIQHALVMQRATRELTPTRAGGLVDLDGARKSMREEHATSRQLIARGDATLEELETNLTGLEVSRGNYDAERGTLTQRNQLYFQENVVKAGKAGTLTAASISSIFSSGSMIARCIPQVLLAQAIAYPASWIANYTWAGPARDEALRDGALKVDFEKDGVAHAKRLEAAAGGGPITNIPADDPVWDWGRGIHKNKLQTRLEMMQTRIVEKIEDAMHGMSQAMGISDDDLLQFQALTIKATTADGLTEEEQGTLETLYGRFNNSAQERAWDAGTRGTPYAAHRERWENWNQDRTRVAEFQQAAAKDESSEIWKELSPDAKEMLNHHLSPHLDEGAIKTFIEYRKGSKSGSEFMQFTHEVSEVTVRDWRLLDADKNLKLNRPFAYLGFGGSLGTILKGQVFSLVKNTTGHALPGYGSALVSGALFGLYLNEIFKQGQAVNLTISQKEDNKELAPSKHDEVAQARQFAGKFVQGMFITSIQGVKSIRGGRERKSVTNDIQTMRTQIATVQARLQAAEAAQPTQAGQGDGDVVEEPRIREV